MNVLQINCKILKPHSNIIHITWQNKNNVKSAECVLAVAVRPIKMAVCNLRRKSPSVRLFQFLLRNLLQSSGTIVYILSGLCFQNFNIENNLKLYIFKFKK